MTKNAQPGLFTAGERARLVRLPSAKPGWYAQSEEIEHAPDRAIQHVFERVARPASIDLEVRAGEVVGLFGTNGVSKTTIVKSIAGRVAPSRGKILFHGEPIHRLTSDQICRRGIGVVPEDRRVFPGLTVEENLRLGGMQVRGRSTRETNAKLGAIYQRFRRLADRRRQLGTTLSGGEQQMLAIARVLMGAPKLLLIDEPLEGLAPMIVDEIFQLMTELRDPGIPLLSIEQNVKRAPEICDRHYAIERGRVVQRGESSSREDRERLMARISV